jgi:aldehyde dehydrogenase (NAD+)
VRPSTPEPRPPPSSSEPSALPIVALVLAIVGLRVPPLRGAIVLAVVSLVKSHEPAYAPRKGLAIAALIVPLAAVPIGVLAAIAIPSFIKYSARSKQSESKMYLKAAFNAEKAYDAEHDTYVTDVEQLGFAPDRGNRYLSLFDVEGAGRGGVGIPGPARYASPMREPIRLNPIAAIAERSRAFFRSGQTLPHEFRLKKLRALEEAIRENEKAVLDALMADLRKAEGEAYPAELGLVYAELRHARKNLARWMKPRAGSMPVAVWPARGWLLPEPRGSTLIISPWNYPFQLAMAPLVGAIAAGCTAVIKPSELSPATSKVIELVARQAFGDDGYVTVVQGAVEESTALLAEKWDLIFFTGSTNVGRVVMQAAAKHLTPVVLELGGKSPTIVDEDIDLEVTARRIAWGKLYNAGQTCIAPDYVLVHQRVKDAFVKQLDVAWHELLGADIEQSPDYGRIISDRHFKRLVGLMGGGRVAVGGQVNEATRFIAPTALVDVKLDHPLMQEEIFGPLLPIIPVEGVDEAIRFAVERPRPLALYVFTRDEAKAEQVLRSVSSGGAVVNDCLVHITSTDLPFGGVGDAGMGGYHGQHSFDTFSHLKTVVKRPHGMDIKVRYPPYSDGKVSLFRRLL